MNVFDQHISDRFAAYHVDTVEFTAGLPDNSVDFSVYSPPFSSLYIYSESERDMGNVANDAAFQACYAPLVRELLRVTKPGRLTAIHVKDLVYYSNSSEKGDRGLRDFTGDCIKTHIDAGWTLHQRTTIERDPVKEMQKTKADRLLFKNFKGDAARSGGGLPEYLVMFRKWAPGMEDVAPIIHDDREFPLDTWQEWANPIWRGLTETDVLNVKIARDDEAEKHLCPMPLNITERAVRLWSNPDELVYSPFMGVGSEGYAAIRAGRRFIGTELKEAYYRQALKYLAEAEQEAATPSLLLGMAS